MPPTAKTQSRISPIGILNSKMRADILCGAQSDPAFHHRVVTTPGIQALSKGEAGMRQIIESVLAFRDTEFTKEFDPSGDRDMITIEFNGETIWAKFDAYDLDLEGGSPNPADDSVTCRVLTVMLRSEY